MVQAQNQTSESILNSHRPLSKTFILGKFEYQTDASFVKVAPELSNKTIYLQQEVYSAFLNMQAAALKDSVQFIIVSGTRNFEEQKGIWERKWKANDNLSPVDRAKKILEYSSMPGTSRHHWGTDMDLNNLSNSYFESGEGLKLYNWLLEHANSFGFYQVYTSKTNGRTGYNEEKWHWSYLPLASKYLAFYNKHISESDIQNFKGSNLATELRMIPDFVNGISFRSKNFK
ncbi:M15 family metallopeptidase [Formosa sp. S-31]|uniref:M15 family metallopeptidase n=1 Tax=Formosa sp. S-31 TaxID=2790949 RepID=UPI003EBFE0C9